MGLSLAGYRPWERTLFGAWHSPWPIARTSLWLVLRRKLFWFLYALALFDFIIFFAGIYLLSQIKGNLAPEDSGGPWLFSGLFGNAAGIIEWLEKQLNLGGNAVTYRNFFWVQGYITMAVLALAGSILIGNDYQHGCLPFYLSKPLGRWHYLLGKFLAVVVFVQLLTTLPALLLNIEYGLLNGWDEFMERSPLILGILGYGAAVSVVLGILVLTVASWARKTIPMVIVWVGLLVFCRQFSRTLADWFQLGPRWRLIDIWNSLYIVGSNLLGTTPDLGRRRNRPPPIQPELWEAALVLGGICIACLIYLNRRIRAVEVVQ